MDNAALAAALQAERDARDNAFLALPEDVAGFDLRPLTLADFLRLSCLENPFLTGLNDPTSPEDLARLFAGAWSIIWLQSVDYAPHDKAAKRSIETKLFNTDSAQLIGAVQEYLNRALYDQPATRTLNAPADSKTYWSFCASIVHAMAKAYGWTLSEIMSTPLRVLWQLWRIQDYQADPKKPRFNKSDEIITEWLQSLKKQNQEPPADE